MDEAKPDYSNLKISLINFRERQRELVIKHRAMQRAQQKRARRGLRRMAEAFRGGWDAATRETANVFDPMALGVDPAELA